MAEHISAFFDRATGNHAVKVPPMLRAVHFYDVTFWPLVIPITYGQVRLNAWEFLEMPVPLKWELSSSASELESLGSAFTEWYAYAMGTLDLTQGRWGTVLEKGLISSARRDIEAAATQLSGQFPNTQAAMSCRLTFEKNLKVLLVRECGASEADLRRRPYGHNLYGIIEGLGEVLDEDRRCRLHEAAEAFPEHGARYEELSISSADLWQSYVSARFAGVTLVERYTDRMEEGG